MVRPKSKPKSVSSVPGEGKRERTGRKEGAGGQAASWRPWNCANYHAGARGSACSHPSPQSPRIFSKQQPAVPSHLPPHARGIQLDLGVKEMVTVPGLPTSPLSPPPPPGTARLVWAGPLLPFLSPHPFPSTLRKAGRPGCGRWRRLWET